MYSPSTELTVPNCKSTIEILTKGMTSLLIEFKVCPTIFPVCEKVEKLKKIKLYTKNFIDVFFFEQFNLDFVLDFIQFSPIFGFCRMVLYNLLHLDNLNSQVPTTF